MASHTYTCTGCVPIDAKIIDVYTQMLGTEARAEQAAEDAEFAAQHAIGKSPYIGENGDWFEWDDDEARFIDTGVQAHGSIVVDTEMSTSSTNPVQNKVVTAAVNEKYTKPASGIPASDIASGVIPDVSQFVTKSVNDLVNYYLKSETYTKDEVNTLIGAIKQFTIVVAQTLPTASASTMYKIYLVPSADPQTQNVKDEYITLESSGVYSWEQIGSTAIDLSGYVTTTELNTALANYTTTANLTTLLAAKQDTISDLSTIRSGAAAGATSVQPAEFNELKDEVDTIGNGAYEEAWDGDSTPVVADIPAGVVVTYSSASYTGTLAASASTVDKIYLVSDGNGNYDRYVTVESSGTYSWKKVGTTAIPLSDYATKAEVSQLEAKVDELEDIKDDFIIITRRLTIKKEDFTISGVYKTTDMTISSNANYKSTPIYEVEPGQVFVWANFPNPPAGSFCLSQYAADGTPVLTSANVNNRKVFEHLTDSQYIIPSGVGKIGFVWNEGSAPLSNTSAITSGQDVLALTQEAKDLLNEELGLDDIDEDVQEAVEKADKAQNDIDLVLESIPATKKTPADFTTTGIWKNGIAEVDPSYVNYSATTLLYVVEGQIITFHKWQQGSALFSVAAIFCYDNDGLPYDGVSARRNYVNMLTADYVNGEYTFKVPSNCSQIGLSFNFNSYPVQEGAEIIIQEESIALTDRAKELINNAVEQGNEVGDDSAKYYLKGNSNIVYSPAKKLGIIAAGQSNIDGRNSYSDLPAGFVNPNAKVRYCDNTSGTFADFQVTDGGANNDWSFDAIVYDLLTKSAYGNQSEIFVMKHSMGGTSIDPLGATEYHWTADYEFLDSPSHSLLRTFETIVRKGVETQGTNFDIKAMLWHQGEGDMQNETVANRYYENLKNMLAYVRGVVGNPRLYFFCGNISLNRTSPGYVEIINAAYTKIASEDPYFKVVDMSNAQLEDGYHFDYQWSIYFGQKVYDLMIDAGIISGTKINPSEPS